MAHSNFVHLRAHSAYSLSEGAIHVKALVGLAAEQGMPAVAITDSGNLFGALEFSEVASGKGVQPIVGSLLAVKREGGTGEIALEPDPVVLLVQNEAGYENLLKLVSAAFLDTEAGVTPQVSFEDLAAHGEGLLVLSGGTFGPVGRLVLEGQEAAASALLDAYAEAFPGRFYVELHRHGRGEDSRVEAFAVAAADARDLPLVATNDAYFADAGMYEAHDALLCVSQGCTLDHEDRWRLTPEHFFKSAEAMRELFADLPDALDNTLTVARRCAFRVAKRKPILPHFEDASGASEEEILRRVSAEGLEERLAAQVLADLDPEADEETRAAAAAPYRERLAFELGVIIEMGFAGYFLIVADFIQWAKAEEIPVGPGRGSGAGSLVAWVLKITDLDPLEFNLLFERFLNPDRVSMPDFDIDFCQDRRDEVIRYVQDKYGHDQVAQIITFGKLQARAVLRDAGRVLGMPYGQVDRLCKMVPNNPANPVTLAQAIQDEPRLQEEKRNDPTVERLIDISLRLEGLYRHASTHAAGVVIGDRPLERLVPLYRDPRSDMPVTQFNMKWVEQAGLVKFDFLGLKTLTVLQRAVALIAETGVEIDINRVPLDDGDTYAMLQRAEALGVFQFESSGMRDLLREAEPTNIEDLIALVALYRPGPMENIPKYIACKHGREQPEFLHETIEPVVSDTYGVIIYQEQVMQIAQVFAGYSLGQADLLRRAMGKKIKAEMDAQREVFVNGAVERKVDRDRASYVFDLVDKFAGYGFNKAHSAGYALVAYQTAYLKANHPVEFMAASMTLDMGNTDKLNLFRQELDRMKIGLLPPDVNRSGVDFTVERPEEGRGKVRYALAAIRNVGREAMRAIVAEREANGAYRDLWDFASRMDPRQINRRALENLARAGAFDSLNDNRAQTVAAAEMMMRYAQRESEERESAQVSLFGGEAGGGITMATPDLPDLPDWLELDRLAQESEAIGFFLSAHPLDSYASLLKRERIQNYAEVVKAARAGATAFRMAGTVLRRQERKSSRGNAFAFVQLSDRAGMFEVMVFSEELAGHREELEAGRSVLLDVEGRMDGGEEPRLSVRRIRDIDKAAEDGEGELIVFIRDPAPLDGIQALLNARRKGRSRVTLRLTLPDEAVEADIVLPGGFTIDARVRGAIKGVTGVVDVHDA